MTQVVILTSLVTVCSFLHPSLSVNLGNREMSCSSHIEITVLDENDNAPQWTQELLSATLKEDMPVGTVVTKVEAQDPDVGENRRLKYRFSGSNEGTFKARYIIASGDFSFHGWQQELLKLELGELIETFHCFRLTHQLESYIWRNPWIGRRKLCTI